MIKTTSRDKRVYLKSFDNYEDALDSYSSFASFGNYNRTFLDFDTNTSVRSEFNRTDYDFFRPNEKSPVRIEDTIYWSMQAYKKIGIINNVINLMGDFTSQGIKFVHPNRKIQKFHDSLAEEWKLRHVSERFANTLYRTGSVIIHGLEGKISITQKNKWSKVTGAKTDIKLLDTTTQSKIIPLKYIIYHPLSLDVLNKAEVLVGENPKFGLRISKNMFCDLNNDNRNQNNFSREVYDALQNGKKNITLDPKKVSAFYYKKDDWELWGTPVTAPILDDLQRLEKLNLADMAALDGAISQVRHWRVGSLEHKIAPTNVAINKLRNILSKNVSGGVRELVTGPEIDFKESDTKVHQFLGSEKYQATLTAIYAGLGIPPTLTGVSTASGFTNNYISIKTLVERLEYGRTKLIEFWQSQLNKVAEALGFDSPAKVVFDQMVLSDESAEKALLLQLADRDIISHESLRGRFDLDDDIERLRIEREYKERSENMDGPQKSGPFHNPEKIHEYYKSLLGGGDITPSQIGLDLPDKKPGEKTRLEQQLKMKQKQYNPPKPNGRPINKKDSIKRKQKRVTPRTSAELFVWATSAYNQSAEIVTNLFLSMLKKKNVRTLTVAETAQLESVKTNVFFNITPFATIDENLVYNIIESKNSLDYDSKCLIVANSQSFIENNKRKPNTEEMRNIVIATYVEKN